MWMCKTNLICRNGKLDLSPASEAPGIPMSLRFDVLSKGNGEYYFEGVEMTDEFDVERIELFGEAKEKAIEILLERVDLWEEFCVRADYERIGAV